MAQRRHRNLFREYLDAHARKRAEGGLAPFTHAEWAAYFNGLRPSIGGKRVREIAESSISRAASTTPGVARRIGMDRSWILGILKIDYTEYIAAWGSGPDGAAYDRRKAHGR